MDIQGTKLPAFKLKKGALHKMLGVSPKKKLTTKQLEQAKASGNPLERKRAQFAINARKFKHQ